MSDPKDVPSGVELITGHVAFIDILGFRAIVSRPDVSDKLREYAEAVGAAAGAADRKGVEYIVFSDTIVMYDGVRDNEMDGILMSCSVLFEKLLKAGFPFRGCISYGQFCRHKGRASKGTLVAGEPIIEAFGYEGRQNWIGIMLAPSMIRRHWSNPKANHPFRSPYIWEYSKIPLRGAATTDSHSFGGFAVIPEISSGVKENYARIIRELKRLRMLAPDGASQQKYRNTIEFLRHVKCQFLKKQRATSARKP